jgi:hypothetical protein
MNIVFAVKNIGIISEALVLIAGQSGKGEF